MCVSVETIRIRRSFAIAEGTAHRMKPSKHCKAHLFVDDRSLNTIVSSNINRYSLWRGYEFYANWPAQLLLTFVVDHSDLLFIFIFATIAHRICASFGCVCPISIVTVDLCITFYDRFYRANDQLVRRRCRTRCGAPYFMSQCTLDAQNVNSSPALACCIRDSTQTRCYWSLFLSQSLSLSLFLSLTLHAPIRFTFFRSNPDILCVWYINCSCHVEMKLTEWEKKTQNSDVVMKLRGASHIAIITTTFLLLTLECIQPQKYDDWKTVSVWNTHKWRNIICMLWAILYQFVSCAMCDNEYIFVRAPRFYTICALKYDYIAAPHTHFSKHSLTIHRKPTLDIWRWTRNHVYSFAESERSEIYTECHNRQFCWLNSHLNVIMGRFVDSRYFPSCANYRTE